MNRNNVTDDMVYTYICHNDFMRIEGTQEFYECPGGHSWHWVNIVELIEQMSAQDFYNLCLQTERDAEIDRETKARQAKARKDFPVGDQPSYPYELGDLH